MEYLIGIYIMGWVLCSIFLVWETTHNSYKFREYTKLQLWGVGIFTCFVWSVFVLFWLRVIGEDRR